MELGVAVATATAIAAMGNNTIGDGSGDGGGRHCFHSFVLCVLCLIAPRRAPFQRFLLFIFSSSSFTYMLMLMCT